MSGDSIRAFDVVHFAASTDKPADLTVFAQKLGADYPLLGDPTRAVALAYGVVHDDQVFAARWTFYIGIDGKILYIDKSVSTATAGQDIARRLGELGVKRRAAPKGSK